MKRKTKIACAVLAGLVVAVGGAAYWQRSNVDAVLKAAKYSADELEQQRQENQQKVQQVVDSMPSITVRDLTDEERQALREGSVTQEELTEKLLEAAAPQPIAQEQPSAQPSAPPAASQDSQSQPPDASAPPPQEVQPAQPAQWEKDLSALVARVYVLREQYTIALDEMQAQATEEYHAMKTSERTKTALVKFAKGYVTKALDLEKECDAQMDSIVRQMETIIRENGGDMTLVDTVVETYASEKSLKKAWYMAELEKRGWI